MPEKVLIIESVKRPLKQLRTLLKKNRYEVVIPNDTDSIFNICKRDDISAIVVDEVAFGKRGALMLKNLRENVLPNSTALITFKADDKIQNYKTLRKLAAA